MRAVLCRQSQNVLSKHEPIGAVERVLSGTYKIGGMP
jgi:hypothetical protein